MSAGQLEIVVANEKKNQLLGRTELIVQVKHLGQATPNRQTLRKEIGRNQKASPEQVYIQKIVTDYGAGISDCIVNIYKTVKQGEESEPEYMRKRNAPPEAKKEAAASAPPAPAAPAPEAPPTAPEAPAQTEAGEKEAPKPKAPKKPAKEKPSEAAAETPATPSPEKPSGPQEPKAEAKETGRPKAGKEKSAKEKSAEAKPSESEKKES